MVELRAAARAPVHAYLLVGPPGTGKRAAARCFAASLLCTKGGCGACRDCQLALSGAHPDLVVRERTGAFIGVDEAREVSRLAARSPMEARRQILVLTDLHLVDRAAPALLKTIEEPPATTVFVLLADHMVPELGTIASRCVTVELRPLTAAQVESVLLGEGVAPALAAGAAAASGGRLDRARLLVGDDGLGSRQEMWRSVPGRLDGTGVTVARLADELLAAGQRALGPVEARQTAELEELAALAKASGERAAPGRREVEERHRREQRRARVDELRFGLATLAGAYRERLGGLPGDPNRERAEAQGDRDQAAPDSAAIIRATAAAVAAIDGAGLALERNPNEPLLLQALLLQLSGLSLSRGPGVRGRL